MKGLVTGLLLIFVVASVVFLIAKESTDKDINADSSSDVITTSENTPEIDTQSDSAETTRRIADTFNQRGDISVKMPDETENVIDEPQNIGAKKLIAYYFHISRRCYSCVRMQELSQIAIEEGFAKEIESGLVEYKTVNLDPQENRHYLKQFNLTNPTVIIVIEEIGAYGEYENLTRVWQLYNNPDAFIEYIQTETKKLMDKHL